MLRLVCTCCVLSYPLSVSSWCGRTMRRPRRNSCHSVCSGTASPPCAAACGFLETSWLQTWCRIPHTRRAFPPNAQCACGTTDLRHNSKPKLSESTASDPGRVIVISFVYRKEWQLILDQHTSGCFGELTATDTIQPT